MGEATLTKEARRVRDEILAETSDAWLAAEAADLIDEVWFEIAHATGHLDRAELEVTA